MFGTEPSLYYINRFQAISGIGTHSRVSRAVAGFDTYHKLGDWIDFRSEQMKFFYQDYVLEALITFF